jgi:TRAP-type mannitol/chloroaromatic compound transport system permease small subunit
MVRVRLAALAIKIDRLTALVGRAAAWCALFITLVQVAVVLMRYVLGVGSIWLQELVLYAHASLFMLGAAWTLQADRHVRVDIFYADASPRHKALVDLFGALVFLFPFCFALLWLAFPYVARSFAILERSREASGLPFVFILKSLILLFAALLALQGVAQLIRSVLSLSGAGEPRAER